MFNDSSDNNLKLVNSDQFDQIQDKFLVLSLLNVQNFVVSFKHCPNGGYIDNILELKSNSCYISMNVCILSQIYGYKVTIFKMSINGIGSRVAFVIWM